MGSLRLGTGPQTRKRRRCGAAGPGGGGGRQASPVLGRGETRVARRGRPLQGGGYARGVLRSKRIYSSMLSSWRKQLEAADRMALAPKKQGPKPDPSARQIEQLNRENARLRRKLERARFRHSASTLGGWRESVHPARDEGCAASARNHAKLAVSGRLPIAQGRCSTTIPCCGQCTRRGV